MRSMSVCTTHRPFTATIVGTFGMVLAEQCYREAFEGRLRRLGPDHPDTLASQYGLAAILGEQGKFEQVRPLLLDALERSRRAGERTHKLTAELIAYLAEVDARKLYLVHATPSMFVFAVTKLGFSEDEACRRIEAARLARRFPCIFRRIERGEVSLSVLGRLKSFLTDENAVELLDAARGRTVREVERVLAARFPKPDIPDSIRKLPEPNRASPPALFER